MKFGESFYISWGICKSSNFKDSYVMRRHSISSLVCVAYFTNNMFSNLMALLKSLLQDWTGMNFQSIMDDAEKIKSTVCITRNLYLYV